eukprot:3141340-Prymnesium_polylepis.1
MSLQRRTVGATSRRTVGVRGRDPQGSYQPSLDEQLGADESMENLAASLIQSLLRGKVARRRIERR